MEKIRLATSHDLPELMAVINQAYEVEHYIKEGDRTDLSELERRLKKGFFLVFEEDNEIGASIYVEIRGDRGFFGMLAVRPDKQGRKLGFKMIAAAENFAREKECTHMDIQILSVRKELPPFYRMVGYTENGTSELPEGIDLKIPCHFINMTKKIRD